MGVTASVNAILPCANGGRDLGLVGPLTHSRQRPALHLLTLLPLARRLERACQRPTLDKLSGTSSVQRRRSGKGHVAVPSSAIGQATNRTSWVLRSPPTCTLKVWPCRLGYCSSPSSPINERSASVGSRERSRRINLAITSRPWSTNSPRQRSSSSR